MDDKIAMIAMRRRIFRKNVPTSNPGGRGGVPPYMGYTGMCHCEGYGFLVFKQFTLG